MPKALLETSFSIVGLTFISNEKSGKGSSEIWISHLCLEC